MESTTPPFSSTHRWWWLRPIVIVPASNERPETCKEFWFSVLPGLGGVLTFLVLLFIFLFIDAKAQNHAQFSIQSIAVDSSATWHIDFLVKNPSSRYSIYYDEAAVKLGHLNAPVLNISHKRSSRDLSAFSLAFVVEGNGNALVYEQLEIKLRGKHNCYVTDEQAGHFDVTCQNLTQSHENINKIKCKSSFSRLNYFPL